MTDNSALVAAALQTTNPVLAQEMDASNSWKSSLVTQGAKVALYRAYERGDHRASITDQMRRMLRLPEEDLTGLDALNDNYMKLVIDKMASRIAVNDVSVTAAGWSSLLNNVISKVAKVSTTVAASMRSLMAQVAGAADEAASQQWLSELLERNNFDYLQGVAIRSAIRDGESFFSVDPRTGRWSVEETYDGYDGVVAIMGSDGRTPVWAAKLWTESSPVPTEGNSSVVKIVVYMPGSVTFWKGDPGSSDIVPDNKLFHETMSADGSETVIISTNVGPWKGKVPLIQIVNQQDMSTPNGESELRSGIPLQDMLNRTFHSMIMASEFSAFQIKWSVGMEIDAAGIVPGAVVNMVLKDSEGKVVTDLDDRLIEFLKAVRVGQFEATDLSQYINQIDRIVRELSQNTQTPIYGVTTTGAVSGDALKQLEIGLIGKVERFQNQNVDAFKELILVTSQVLNMFRDTPGAPEITNVGIVWKPAELLDVTQQIDMLVKMRKDAPQLWSDDFYRRKIGALLGMSPQDVAKEGEASELEAQNQIDALTARTGSNLPIV